MLLWAFVYEFFVHTCRHEIFVIVSVFVLLLFSIIFWWTDVLYFKNVAFIELKFTYHNIYTCKVYKLLVLVYSQDCAIITTNSRTSINQKKKKNPLPARSNSSFPPLLALGNHWSTFCLELTILYASYKWNHIWSFSYLACLLNVFEIHPCAAWLNTNSLNGGAILHCMHIPHFFIHLLLNIWIVSIFWLLWIMLLWPLCTSSAWTWFQFFTLYI